MKKLMQLSLAVFCTAFMFTSCESQVDKDITKAKDYICQITKLQDKVEAGDAEAMAEYQKIGEDMTTWLQEIKPNYPEGSEEATKFETELDAFAKDAETNCK